MFADLNLIHRPAGRSSIALADTLGASLARHERADAVFFSWQTCLRQIVLVDDLTLETVRPDLDETDEIREGNAAYAFLLEVICGLHSPLIGETEVYGQFKNACAAFVPPVNAWGSGLKRTFCALFEDAKRIRAAHLEDLGSQSYGSVLRRELKGHRRIHILGAGQLVQEILPWLAKDGTEIHVYARDAAKARLALKAFAGVSVHALRDAALEPDGSRDALIVAAPVTASFVQLWAKTDQLAAIADLRADSATDRIEASASVLDLGEIFNRISSNQLLLEARKKLARQAIEAAVAERGTHVEYRPFGWEDVCA